MQRFNESNDILYTIAQHLDAGHLFSFAKVSKLYRDIAQTVIFRQPLNDKQFEKHRLKLLRYWTENPHTLLNKKADFHDLLKKNLKESLKYSPNENLKYFGYDDSLILTYSCLVILSAIQKNQAEFKEYFYRLWSAADFNFFILIPLLSKIIQILGGNHCYQSLYDYLSQDNYLSEIKDELITYSLAIFSKDLKIFVNLLHEQLETKMTSSNLLGLQSIVHILTTDDALRFVSLLVKEILQCSERPPQNKSDKVKLIALCLNKLTSSEMDKLLNTILVELHRVLMQPAETIKPFEFENTFDLLSLCLNKLNQFQLRNLFKKLLMYFPITSGESHYLALLIKLVQRVDDRYIGVYINKLDQAISDCLSMETLIDFDQSLKKIDLRLLKQAHNYQKHFDFDFVNFLKLFLKMSGKLELVIQSFSAKLFKSFLGCSTEQIFEYVNILQSLPEKTINNRQQIQITLLNALPTEVLVKHIESTKPHLNLIIDIMKNIATFKLSEIKAYEWFQANFNNYLTNPHEYAELMALIAKHLSQEKAEYYLQKIIEGKLEKEHWQISNYYINMVTTQLINRCCLGQTKDLVNDLFKKYLKADNVIFKSRLCDILKLFFSRFSFNEIKEYIPLLLKEFTQNSNSKDYPVDVIVPIIHHLDNAQIEKLINITLSKIKVDSDGIDVDLCRELINKFTPDQITFLFNHHWKQQVNTVKYVTTTNKVCNILTILIPRLNPEQLLTLFQFNSLFATYIRSNVQKIQTEPLINIYTQYSDRCEEYKIINSLFNYANQLITPMMEDNQEEDYFPVKRLKVSMNVE